MYQYIIYLSSFSDNDPTTLHSTLMTSAKEIPDTKLPGHRDEVDNAILDGLKEHNTDLETQAVQQVKLTPQNLDPFYANLQAEVAEDDTDSEQSSEDSHPPPQVPRSMEISSSIHIPSDYINTPSQGTDSRYPELESLGISGPQHPVYELENKDKYLQQYLNDAETDPMIPFAACLQQYEDTTESPVHSAENTPPGGKVGESLPAFQELLSTNKSQKEDTMAFINNLMKKAFQDESRKVVSSDESIPSNQQAYSSSDIEIELEMRQRSVLEEAEMAAFENMPNLNFESIPEETISGKSGSLHNIPVTVDMITSSVDTSTSTVAAVNSTKLKVSEDITPVIQQTVHNTHVNPSTTDHDPDVQNTTIQTYPDRVSPPPLPRRSSDIPLSSSHDLSNIFNEDPDKFDSDDMFGDETSVVSSEAGSLAQAINNMYIDKSQGAIPKGSYDNLTKPSHNQNGTSKKHPGLHVDVDVRDGCSNNNQHPHTSYVQSTTQMNQQKMFLTPQPQKISPQNDPLNKTAPPLTFTQKNNMLPEYSLSTPSTYAEQISRADEEIGKFSLYIIILNRLSYSFNMK